MSTKEKQQMHAFVTGATGFIGSNLVNELVGRNYSISCLVRSHTKAIRSEERRVGKECRL